MKTTLNKTLRTITTSPAFTDFSTMLKTKWRLHTVIRSSAIKNSKPPQDRSLEDILCDLVSIPTVTGKLEANDECLYYIEHFLRSYGMHVTRLSRNGVGSLIATTRKTKTPTVFLMAHQDVVEAPAELFTLRKEDGKYFGRGVLDMKCAIAAYLGVVQQLAGKLDQYDFGIMIVSDEEIGGFDGAAFVAEQGYHSKVMVIPDGGIGGWDLEEAAKGLWWLTIEADGKPAHGSRPWLGVNAIDSVLAAANDIKALFPDVGPETNSISMNVINAGMTINQIPATASVSFDMRPISAEEQTRLHIEIAEIAEKHGVRMTTESEVYPLKHDLKSYYLGTYKACVEEVVGKPVGTVLSRAASDARYFVSFGTEFAIGYPKGGDHHGLGEWIAEESPAQMQQIFLNYLDRVAKD